MSENPPAFPSIEEHPSYDMPMHHFGMDLRDWFAGQAIGALIAAPNADYTAAQQIACDAYTLADAMLAARQILQGDQ